MPAYGQGGYGEGEYGRGAGLPVTVDGEAFTMGVTFLDGLPPPEGEAFAISLNFLDGIASIKTDVWIPADLGFEFTRWLARGNHRYLDRANWRLGEAELVGIYEDGRLRPIRLVGGFNEVTETAETLSPGGTL